jgi:protein O-GlcNAc transferase
MINQVGSIPKLLQRAIQLYQEGFYSQAESFTRQILRLQPSQADSDLLQHLISQQFNLFSPTRPVSIDESRAGYYYGLALLCRNLGSLDEAVSLFHRALSLNPNSVEMINHLGETLGELGQVDEAISYYKKAIEKKPDFAQSYNNLGNAAQMFQEYGQSVLYYKKAISLQADFMEAYQNWGYVLRCQGYPDKAIPCYQKATSINPLFADGWLELGHVYFDLGHISEAQESYRKALKVKPGFFQAYNALGVILREFGNLDQAIQHFLKATRIKPDYSAAFVNLAQAYELQGLPEKAQHAYQQALKIDPTNPQALGFLSFLLQELCDWEELAKYKPRLDDEVRKALEAGELPAEAVFINITRHSNPLLNLSVARSWSQSISKKIHRTHPFDYTIAEGCWSDPKEKKGKIRLGYLSNDFRVHAIFHHISELFKRHDRNRFEVYGYSYDTRKNRSKKGGLQDRFDCFVDIHELSYVEAAERIHGDEINILIDLTGHTRDNRMEICALRPAPVQISYLGFPGSSGADYMDFIIADKITVPEKHRPFYSETVVHLPSGYQINSRKEEAAAPAFSRCDFLLPEKGVIFSSFSHPYKIDAKMFGVWMQILEKVPDSVLWLKQPNLLTQNNLLKEAKKGGISASRLIFSKKELGKGHRSQIQLADLVLDTRIHNGQASSSDALWAGIPVITLEGDHFASRIGSSTLQTMELPELVTRSLEEYQSLAIHLATNPDLLLSLQEKIAQKRETAPLFNTEQSIQELESTYEMIWLEYLQKRATQPKVY